MRNHRDSLAIVLSILMLAIGPAQKGPAQESPVQEGLSPESAPDVVDALAEIQQQLQDISIEELLEKLARVQSISYDGRKHLRLRAQYRLVMEQAQSVRQRYLEDTGGFKTRVDRVVSFLRAEGQQLLDEQDDAMLEIRFKELREQHQVSDRDIESFVTWADAWGAYQICVQEMAAIDANLEASIPRIAPPIDPAGGTQGSLVERATQLSVERKRDAPGKVVSGPTEPPPVQKQERARDVLQKLLSILPDPAAA